MASFLSRSWMALMSDAICGEFCGMRLAALLNVGMVLDDLEGDLLLVRVDLGYLDRYMVAKLEDRAAHSPHQDLPVRIEGEELSAELAHVGHAVDVPLVD